MDVTKESTKAEDKAGPISRLGPAPKLISQNDLKNINMTKNPKIEILDTEWIEEEANIEKFRLNIEEETDNLIKTINETKEPIIQISAVCKPNPNENKNVDLKKEIMDLIPDYKEKDKQDNRLEGFYPGLNKPKKSEIKINRMPDIDYEKLIKEDDEKEKKEQEQEREKENNNYLFEDKSELEESIIMEENSEVQASCQSKSKVNNFLNLSESPSLTSQFQKSQMIKQVYQQSLLPHLKKENVSKEIKKTENRKKREFITSGFGQSNYEKAKMKSLINSFNELNQDKSSFQKEKSNLLGPSIFDSTQDPIASKPRFRYSKNGLNSFEMRQQGKKKHGNIICSFRNKPNKRQTQNFSSMEFEFKRLSEIQKKEELEHFPRTSKNRDRKCTLFIY